MIISAISQLVVVVEVTYQIRGHFLYPVTLHWPIVLTIAVINIILTIVIMVAFTMAVIALNWIEED